MDWTATIIAASAGLAALGTLAAAARFTHRRLLRPLQLMAEDWHGQPERRGSTGQLIADGRPGVMERLKAMDTRQASLEQQITVVRMDVAALRGDTAEVKGQLRPNGGESVYDKVTRVAEAFHHEGTT